MHGQLGWGGVARRQGAVDGDVEGGQKAVEKTLQVLDKLSGLGARPSRGRYVTWISRELNKAADHLAGMARKTQRTKHWMMKDLRKAACSDLVAFVDAAVDAEQWAAS